MSSLGYVVWYRVRTALESDINPRDSTILDMSFVAPDKPGHYFVEIDLVAEGEAWYSSVATKQHCCCVNLIVDSDV